MAMIEPVAFHKFILGWLPSLAVSAVMPAPTIGEVSPGDMAVVIAGGVPIPVVTCVLGLLGIALSRPLARRGEAQLSWTMFGLVSAIMLILVELWIIESRPGWLFAFVVSIGLGFSGYSLIEVLGAQAQDFVRGLLSRARATNGSTPQDGDRQ